jgi:hypothetical protein
MKAMVVGVTSPDTTFIFLLSEIPSFSFPMDIGHIILRDAPTLHK